MNIENIEPTVKLFADGSSLFSVIHDNNTSAEVLNRDLQKMSKWAHKWKMSFNLKVSNRLRTLYSQGNKPNQSTQI